MRNVLLTLGLGLGLGLGAGAGLAPATAGAADDAAIEALIRDQFAAFAEGDVTEAYGYASPMIRQMFGDAETFGRMVQGGYPMIWGAENVRFLGLRQEDGRLLEMVEVTGPDGTLAYFDYEMVQIDGVWRINGVWPVEDRSLGV